MKVSDLQHLLAKAESDKTTLFDECQRLKKELAKEMERGRLYDNLRAGIEKILDPLAKQGYLTIHSKLLELLRPETPLEEFDRLAKEHGEGDHDTRDVFARMRELLVQTGKENNV